MTSKRNRGISKKDSTRKEVLMKRITYDPRKGGRFRVRINGKLQPGKEALLTKSQILRHGLKLLADGQIFSIGRATDKIAPPKKKTTDRHSSDYRNKQQKRK